MRGMRVVLFGAAVLMVCAVAMRVWSLGAGSVAAAAFIDVYVRHHAQHHPAGLAGEPIHATRSWCGISKTHINRSKMARDGFSRKHIDGPKTWDGFVYGPEVGTYHATLNFVVSGQWAIGIQFHRDSLSPIERTDWHARRAANERDSSGGP